MISAFGIRRFTQIPLHSGHPCL